MRMTSEARVEDSDGKLGEPIVIGAIRQRDGTLGEVWHGKGRKAVARITLSPVPLRRQQREADTCELVGLRLAPVLRRAVDLAM